MIEEVLKLMPIKARSLKTMPKTIKDAVENYGLEKVRKVAVYMKKNKVDKVRAYFIKALENDWTKDEEDIVVVKKEEKVELLDINELEIRETPIENKMTRESLKKFNELSEEEKLEVEKEAYQYYIKKCGQDTKIQKIAFKAGKATIVCDYLEEKNYFEAKKYETSLQSIGVKLSDDKKQLIKSFYATDIPGFAENKYIPKTMEDCIKATVTIYVDKGIAIKKLNSTKITYTTTAN